MDTRDDTVTLFGMLGNEVASHVPRGGGCPRRDSVGSSLNRFALACCHTLTPAGGGLASALRCARIGVEFG
jgi:hypothetical protein